MRITRTFGDFATWPIVLILTLFALMFVGGSAGSTSGGIKVTTFAVLGFAMWAEIRGHDDITAFRRRLPTAVVRQALTVALLAVGVVFGTAATLTAISLCTRVTPIVRSHRTSTTPPAR